MPDEVITFRVVGSQAAIQDFRRTAEAVRGISVETGRAGVALQGSTAALGETRRGFIVLSQVVSRASDVARLFGVDITGVERTLYTVTATLGTLTQVVRVFGASVASAAAAVAALLGPLALFTAAALAQAAAIWKAIEALQRWLGLATITQQVQAAWAQVFGRTTVFVEDLTKRFGEINLESARLGGSLQDLHQRQAAIASNLPKLIAEYEREQEAQARAAKAASAHAAALAKQGLAAREAAEELADLIAWERVQDEVQQVAVPRWQALAKAIQGAVYEARGYAIAARDAILAQRELNELLRWAQERTGEFNLEAEQLGGALQDYHQRLKAAQPVTEQFTETIERMALSFTAAEIPFEGLVTEIISGWDKLQQHLQLGMQMIQESLIEAFGALGPGILGVLQGVGDAVGNFFGDIVQGAKTFAESVADFFKGIGDSILNLVQNLISNAAVAWLISMVAPGLGGFSTIFRMLTGLSFAQGGISPGPLIPVAAFQGGGIVTRPTLAMIGEGGPELITPLSRLGHAGETIVNLTVYVEPPRTLGPEDVIKITAADWDRRGPIHKMIRMTSR